METNKKNTTSADTAASYFAEELPQIFADLRMDALKIRAAALAASEAADSPDGRHDPVSLAEIAADYASELNARLDKIESKLYSHLADLQ